MSGFDVSYLTITTIEILYRVHFKVIAVTKVELLAASLFQMKFTQFIAVLLCNFILYTVEVAVKLILLSCLL